jgi:hypothetical protein
MSVYPWHWRWRQRLSSKRWITRLITREGHCIQMSLRILRLIVWKRLLPTSQRCVLPPSSGYSSPRQWRQYTYLKIGKLLLDYTTQHPRSHIHSQRRHKLKSHHCIQSPRKLQRLYQGWPQRGCCTSLTRFAQDAFNNVRALRTKYFISLKLFVGGQ